LLLLLILPNSISGIVAPEFHPSRAHLPFDTHQTSLLSPCCRQDHQVITAIASYFQHPIPEVAWNNEDQFISVLNKAGLTDQTA
jgi:hypothetical protein